MPDISTGHVAEWLRRWNANDCKGLAGSNPGVGEKVFTEDQRSGSGSNPGAGEKVFTEDQRSGSGSNPGAGEKVFTEDQRSGGVVFHLTINGWGWCIT